MKTSVPYIVLLAAPISCFPSLLLEVRNTQELQILSRAKEQTGPTALSISKREVSSLGNFSLTTHLSNELLFSVPIDAQIADLNISATCIECSTTGTGILSSTAMDTNQELLDDIPGAAAALLDDPQSFIADAFDLDFQVDFQDLSGHFEFEVDFAGAGEISIPLLPKVSPLGVDIAGNKLGFVFGIDLVITVDAELDFTAGFDIVWPKGPSFTIDPLSGELLSMSTDKVDVNSIPIKVQSGIGCATLALKYSLTAGIGFNLIGSEFTIESGLFVNAPIYHACVKFDPEAPCNLEFAEDFAADAGAFAQIVADLNFVDFEAGPSVVTTFLSGDLPSICLATSTSLESGAPMPTAMPVYTNATTTAVGVTSTSTVYHTKTHVAEPVETGIVPCTTGSYEHPK